jgi:hydroxypyruvate reductase
MDDPALPDLELQLLQRLYRAMLSAADPVNVVPPALPAPPKGRTVVVALGKAGAAMAQAVEAHWPEDAPLSGVAVVPKGSALPLRRLQCLEASHPVPDERSVLGAKAMLAAVNGLTHDDLVLALISGGGSALAALPAEGVSLDEKQAITKQLLRSGAPISAINVVRKHLSAIKGGRLALAARPARVVTLVISDIPGDDPALVASGPTVADPSTCADALALLDRFGVQITANLRERLQAGALESAKPAQLQGVAPPVVIASARQGLEAAHREAEAAGWTAHVLSDAIEGEARDIAGMHAAIARHVAQRAQPFAPPCVLLSGGEATVTVRGEGRGGRNTEFALALLQALQGEAGVWALSVGTDGLDGNAGAAGAWVSPALWQAAQRQGLSALQHLERNDSAGFFKPLDALVHTGPTHTNINDFRALLIRPA